MKKWGPIYRGVKPCSSIVEGWTWYCCDHDAHGSADNPTEVRFGAVSHRQVMGVCCEILLQRWIDGIEVLDEREVRGP